MSRERSEACLYGVCVGSYALLRSLNLYSDFMRYGDVFLSEDALPVTSITDPVVQVDETGLVIVVQGAEVRSSSRTSILRHILPITPHCNASFS